jgi:cell wall-associated NlpC family hydrolase
MSAMGAAMHVSPLATPLKLAFLSASAVWLSACSAHIASLPLVEPAAPSSSDHSEPPPTARAARAIDFASARVGHRYCWGGTGPACFDCSGLVEQAWASAGVRIPRTTGAIASALPEVPLDRLRAGDILWWPGHVGIYEGDGWMIDALDTRHGVVRRPMLEYGPRAPRRAFRP